MKRYGSLIKNYGLTLNLIKFKKSILCNPTMPIKLDFLSVYLFATKDDFILNFVNLMNIICVCQVLADIIWRNSNL